MRTPNDSARALLSQKVAEYHAQVDGAATYLADRGINRSAIDKFQLGYDGSRLTIPYLSPAGPWQIKRRCIQPHNCDDYHHPKYLYDEGAELHLFNAQTLIGAERAVLVEGELDAVAVEMTGVPAVAFPGVEAWKKNRFWAWCFDSLTELVVVADGDPPEKNPRNKHKNPDDPGWVRTGVGEDAARYAADALRTALPDLDVRMVALPLGQDSNSYLNEFGELDYLDRLGLL